MAVPPVLSSTSAEYSLQEVKGCTNINASVSATELASESEKAVSAVRVL